MDFIEKFEFVSNDRLLVVFGSYTSSASYIINLQTFDAKLLNYGDLVEIKNIDDKKEIVLEIKSYKDGGGAFWYRKTYDENGNILENKNIDNFLKLGIKHTIQKISLF